MCVLLCAVLTCLLPAPDFSYLEDSRELIPIYRFQAFKSRVKALVLRLPRILCRRILSITSILIVGPTDSQGYLHINEDMWWDRSIALEKSDVHINYRNHEGNGGGLGEALRPEGVSVI